MTDPVPIDAKVAHVRAADQVRAHACHWPGCDQQVAPARWGCLSHWYRLPPRIRSAIWRAYRIGQESDGRPSADYLAAARAAQDWIACCGGGAAAGVADRQGKLFDEG